MGPLRSQTMTEKISPGDDAAQLKGRRRGQKPVALVGNTALSQPDEKPPPRTIGEAMLRSESSTTKVLFAPNERPAVIQNTGYVPAAVMDDAYVTAECDVAENFVPHGARTPVSRNLWSKGALVRKDIYALWQQLQKPESQE